MTSHSRWCLSAAFVVLAAPFSMTANAEAVVEEIVVTAQKREQSLQDVPLSVTAVSGDRLAELNKNEISELTKILPGLTYKDGSTDNGRSLQIRGVGTVSFSRGVEQSVGMMVDGVVSDSLATSFLDMNDVQRVEVLRGPQGMLFGKNSSAGLVNIVTSDPTEEFEAGLTLGFGEENEQKIRGHISGALSDTVLARLSVSSTTRDGWVENTAPGVDDYNEKDEQALALKVLFQPDDNLDVMFGYKRLEKGDINAGAIIAETYSAPFNPIYPGQAAALGGTLPSGSENDKIFAPIESEAETEQNVFSLKIDYGLGDYNLVSITSFTDAHIIGNARGFSIPTILIPMNLSDGEREQFTQEFRVESPVDQSVSWVAGYYYYNNELDRTFNRTIDINAFAGAPVVQNLNMVASGDNESHSLFGQATFNLSDTARLSIGGRFTDEEVDLDQTVSRISPDPVTGLPSIPEVAANLGSILDSASETNFSWRVIGEWDFSDDAMLFASVARGYKGPGMNMLASGSNSSNPTPIVDPEIPTNFEVGIKSTWYDGRLQLNASAFYTEFEDFQASLAVVQGTSPNFFLENAGELQTEGLEVELTALPTENLLVALNLALVNATFEEYEGAECYGGQTVAQGCVNRTQDLSGGDMPYSPDLSYSIYARQDFPLDSMPFNLYAQALYYWQDDAMYATNNNPAAEIDSYGLLDLAVGLESDAGRYSAQFWVKNATDEFYPTDITIAPSFGIGLGYTLEYTYTRRYGVTLSMNF